MTIHAYTEPRGPNPAYINISERVSKPSDVIVTVRSSGESSTGTIVLSREQLRQLVDDARKHLDGDKPTEKMAACFGVAGTEDQQLRMRAFDMALNSPGVRDHRDVIGVAGEYHKRIVGDEPMGLAAGASHPGYTRMQPHQRRVVDEHADLVKKADALATFIATKNMAGSVFAALLEAEQMRLYRQLEAMRTYSEILSARIVAFPPA